GRRLSLRARCRVYEDRTLPFGEGRCRPRANGRAGVKHDPHTAHLRASCPATAGNMRRIEPMKLFVFGSSITSSYWNGAATYYRGIYRNLHELGFQITFAEPDIYKRQRNRDLAEVHYAE